MRKINCIIADDEALAREVIESHSKKIAGINIVATCTNGADVFNALKSNHADLLFLDIRMPVMGGFEFLQEYDKLDIDGKKGIKIFMLSSSLDPTDLKKSGNNKYITQFVHKPLTQKTLDEICT